MNKIKIINLPEITAADNTTYIPVSTGSTNVTRKISAANLAGFDNVSYLPQEKSGVEMTQARANIGAAAKSWATIEDNLTIAYSSNPIDPNGDEVFKIENLDSPDGPDVTVNDFGYMYLRKGIYLAAGADIEGVTATDFFNLKGITSPVQAQLDSKAPKSSPTFSGAASFNSIYSTGAINSEDTIYAEQQITGNRVMADEQMIFGPDAVIKIITGYNGSTPIYREFPATELSSSDLNGTQYVMVYGTGTPEENAAELQAAYNEAKKMPKHLGTFAPGDSIEIYKGQTFVNSAIPITHVMVANSNYSGAIALAPIGTFSRRDSQSELNAALARRVTVIIAPGEYNFGQYSAFNLTAANINVVSLTGKRDVKINNISVQANYCTVSGIDCSSGSFSISDSLSSILIDNCSGGDSSFGGATSDGISVPGTFTNCEGGSFSFGASGVASGKFIDCIGGAHSFGTLTATSILRDCRLLTGTYSNYSAGKVINCIDGNGDIINNPPLVASSGSKVKLITLDDPQDSVDDPYSYNLTMDDNGATLIVNDEGMTSSGLIVFDFSNFTTEDLSKPFAVTIVGVGYIYAAYKFMDGPVVQLTSGASTDKTIMLCRDPREGLDTPFARILG